jgi:5-methylcytosine-specific restriction endonuclease McrA
MVESMPADKTFVTADSFRAELRELRRQRRHRVNLSRGERARRAALKSARRNEILCKTASRCHICGGRIDGDDWQADHVLAYSTGGAQTVDNYLPAHSICNNYRWFYEPDEFQWILKLGVWARTQIEKGTPVGRAVAARFCKYDQRRAARRKPQRS